MFYRTSPLTGAGKSTFEFENAGSRKRVRGYVLGLLSHAERKNGWALAEFAGDTAPDGMRRPLNFYSVDAAAIIAHFIFARSRLARSCLRFSSPIKKTERLLGSAKYPITPTAASAVPQPTVLDIVWPVDITAGLNDEDHTGLPQGPP